MISHMTDRNTDYCQRMAKYADVTAFLDKHGVHEDGQILFGSCARGDFSNDSDIDVMILLDVSKESLRTERDRLDQVIWNLDAKYDYDLLFAPIVKSDSEFNQWIDVIPFYKSVRREGVRYA